MAAQLSSAYFGKPPLTEDDFWVAKFFGVPVVKNMPRFVYNASYVVYEKDTSGPSRGPSYLAGLCIALVLVVSVTLTRLGLRAKKTRFGLDDWVLIPGLLCAICYYALYMHSIAAFGMGQLSVNVTYKQLEGMINSVNVGALFSYTAVFSASLSMALLCRRLVDLAYQKIRIALLAYAILIVCIWLSVILLICLFYGFVPAYFDLVWYSKHKAQLPKYDPRGAFYCIGVHFTVDAILFLIPIFVVFKSQIHKLAKFRLCLVFCLGGIHLAAAYMTIRTPNPGKDVTFDVLRSKAIWNLVDMTSAFIVVSLPILNSLLPQKVSSSQSSAVWLASRTKGNNSNTSPKHSSQRDSEEADIGLSRSDLGSEEKDDRTLTEASSTRETNSARRSEESGHQR